jgi:hypothetical protein
MKSPTSRSVHPTKRLRTGLLRAVVAAVLVTVLGIPGIAPAWAEDQPSPLDSALNSDDAKKDRNGAPNGNTLVLLKTAAASDVAKRQRVLDRRTNDLNTAPADCGQNAVLVTRVADTSVVLNEIAGRIAAATELKIAKAAAAELFPATRVFTVVNPQVEVAMRCAELVVQTQRLLVRVATQQTVLEAMKQTPEAQAALAQLSAANTAIKGIPSLAAASQSVATLLPDKGDVTITNNNAAAFESVKRQVKDADQSLDGAARAVKDLERMTEVAVRKLTKSSKPKKPVK